MKQYNIKGIFPSHLQRQVSAENNSSGSLLEIDFILAMSEKRFEIHGFSNYCRAPQSCVLCTLDILFKKIRAHVKGQFFLETSIDIKAMTLVPFVCVSD